MVPRLAVPVADPGHEGLTVCSPQATPRCEETGAGPTTGPPVSISTFSMAAVTAGRRDGNSARGLAGQGGVAHTADARRGGEGETPRRRCHAPDLTHCRWPLARRRRPEQAAAAASSEAASPATVAAAEAVAATAAAADASNTCHHRADGRHRWSRLVAARGRFLGEQRGTRAAVRDREGKMGKEGLNTKSIFQAVMPAADATPTTPLL